VKVAFYAPLKSPDHPLPSGDRAIARALRWALAAGGHEVVQASRLRSFDRSGNAQRQARIARIGARIAARLIARWRASPPDAWLTYHLYHKAPDWLGPAVSCALDLPYVVAEASTGPQQRHGPWALGHAQALAGIRAADTVVFLNPADEPRVREARAGAPDARLAPFIDVAAFAGTETRAAAARAPHAPSRLVTVAMMRPGAKLASYRMLAAALRTLTDLPWQLVVVGDGPARNEVERLFDDLGGRVAFRGALAAPDVASELRRSDLFVWPAVDEAIGMALVEAQACGVPVVAGATPGVSAVVAHQRTGLLCAPGDADAFARAVRRLLADPAACSAMGQAAWRHARERHDIGAAAMQLSAILADAVRRHRARRPLALAAR
jgi:glycosyltransferase involved in cell wall biosynthesis